MIRFYEDVLPEKTFARLLRRIRALKAERLKQTYQTTFWFPLTQEPTNVVEACIPQVRTRLRPRGVIGVEWWLSRMRTTDVRVDFHQDRDEKLALATGKLLHPKLTSVLFLNRAKGGLLAVTDSPPCEENPSKAPNDLDFELAAPKPNRLVAFEGRLTHGVLDANNQIPNGKLPGEGRLRLAIILNWWHVRPTGITTFADAKGYRSLSL
ncbi:MAG: hypothetical protein ACT4TC_20870 [Myxococcaceae bacterium]